MTNELKKAFKAMTPEQQALIGEKRIEGAHTPDEWLELLAPVAEFDARSASVRAGGGGFFERRFARKHDVPDALQSFALPLLPILREDHDPDHELELRLDLTGPDQSAKQVGQGKPYSQGRYQRIVDTLYDDPWFEGHARFVDGADVRFSVIDHVRASRKTKRSASGKIKHKTKSKTKTELSVTVTFPARNYAVVGTQPTPTADVRKESVKAGEDRTVVKLNRVVDPGGSVPGPEQLLELLGNAYTRVDPSRRKKL